MVIYLIRCLLLTFRNALAINCASFVNVYAGPIALGRIGWKVSDVTSQ